MKDIQKTETYQRIPIINKKRLDYVDKLLKEERQKEISKDKKIKLTLVDEKNDFVFSYTLKDSCVIGRRSEVCDIVLDYDRTVSSRQCMLQLKDGKIMITDLGGTNPTYINNKLLNHPIFIKDGDVLGLGRVDLIIHIDD